MLCGCRMGQYIQIPECTDVIALNQDRGSQVLNNNRPKVIAYLSDDLDLFQQINVEFLRRQITENPEFDFLFYVECDNADYRQELDEFVHGNNLDIILFVDKAKAYMRLNDYNGVIYSGIITDADFKVYDIALPGEPRSPFDSVMANVRKRMGFL